MAIGSYTDIYDLDDYIERVDLIKNEAKAAYNFNYVTQSKIKVYSQIKMLEERESRIFEILGIRGKDRKAKIDILNQRVQEYDAAVLNLSGAELRQTFLNILEWENGQEFSAFERDVNDCVNELLQEKGEGSIYEVGRDTAVETIIDFLNTDFNVSDKFKFSSSRGIKEGGNEGLEVGKFTKHQKERWKVLLAQRGYPGWSIDSKTGKGVYNMDLDVRGNSITAAFSWNDITERMTSKQARTKDSTKIQDINNKIKNEILAKTNNPQVLGPIIDHILNTKILNEGGEVDEIGKYAFFVGKNTYEITGILGEIKGLYYLSMILGGNFTEALKWYGGTHEGESGKKPHRDILLKDTFGIQIKNTSKEDSSNMEVGFANANIKTILDRLDISLDMKNLFENYFGTLSFNVPYVYEPENSEGNKYVRGTPLGEGGKSFLASRNTLISVGEDIDKILSFFAATLMYMNIYEEFEKYDANFLYLIGKVFFTASQILSDILLQLEKNDLRFHVKGSLENGKNIITALNMKRRDPDFTSVVLKDLALTSTYRF